MNRTDYNRQYCSIYFKVAKKLDFILLTTKSNDNYVA